MHWFVRLFACYLAVVCQLCLATEYPVIARKGPDLQQTDLGATAKGSTTPTLSLNSVRIPTVSDFVAGSNVSITTSGATVTIAATATDNGITTLTLSGAGVVDVTTSAPNYARIGLSSLSPRTDQMTTWTQTFTAPNIYATGKYYGDGSMLTNLPSGGADGVGITTATLTGGGVVDVTTSAPEYAMISLSSLSPRTDRDTTFTGGLEAAYLYGDGSQLANVVASVVESTTDALTLSEQATTPTTPAAGYAKVWVSAAQDAGGIDGYTVLCLHGDGNDASTNIPDASRNSCSCLAYGNAKISTTQKKFGTASLYFDGAGDYVAVATDGAQDFGCADFTVDCWVWPQTTAATYPSILGSGGGYVAGNFVLYADITDLPNKYHVGSYGNVITLGSTSDIVYDAWTHLAIVRYSGVVTLYVNGVAEDSQAYNGYWNWNNQLKIGRYTTSDNNAYKGYVDEIRLTKGLARWTANFTPPTEAYGVGPAVHLLDSAGLDTILY